MQRDVMVSSDLQRALITEIGNLLSALQNDGQNGFNGYAQFLPVLRNEDDDPDQFYPYFIVRVDSAQTEDDEECWTINVDILLGVHDEDTENGGHYRIMNAINRITTRFCEEPTIGVARYKAFRCLPRMQWALQDTDTYPYFFGAVELHFLAPKPERREPNYG